MRKKELSIQVDHTSHFVVLAKIQPIDGYWNNSSMCGLCNPANLTTTVSPVQKTCLKTKYC